MSNSRRCSFSVQRTARSSGNQIGEVKFSKLEHKHVLCLVIIYSASVQDHLYNRIKLNETINCRYKTTCQRWSSVVLWLYVLYTLHSKLNSSSLEKGWPPGAWLIHTHKQTVCWCGCFKGCFCEHHNHITHCSCWLLRIMAKVTLAGD